MKHPALQSILVWRRWIHPALAPLWTNALGTTFGPRLIVTHEDHRPRAHLDIYPRHAREAASLKRRFGGRILRLTPDVWWKPQEARAYPLRIGRRLIIVAAPALRDACLRRFPGRNIVVIPQGLAFGTGQHATTRMCLRALAAAIPPGAPTATVLDAGCGSGILAIAAAKLGAPRVLAFDLDKSAIRVARENIIANGAQGCVRLKTGTLGDARIKDRFAVVVANIFAPPLVANAPWLIARLAPGGRLILSGLRNTQESGIQRAYRRLRLIDRRRSEGWSCLVFQKP